MQLAIKLSSAGIQKYPHVPVLQSLKAVALARAGRMDEAMQVRAGSRLDSLADTAMKLCTASAAGVVSPGSSSSAPPCAR